MHFSMSSAICVIICLLPCGPFAPMGSFALQLVALVLFYLRTRTMTMYYYGLDIPIPWVMYGAIVSPVTVGALLHWRSDRNQFLVHRLTQRRAEQLQSEKERLDYERRFALHRQTKTGARGDEGQRRPRSETASDAPVSTEDVELSAAIEQGPSEPALSTTQEQMMSVAFAASSGSSSTSNRTTQEQMKSMAFAASSASGSTSNGELGDIDDIFQRRRKAGLAREFAFLAKLPSAFSLGGSSRRKSNAARAISLANLASITEATAASEEQGSGTGRSLGASVRPTIAKCAPNAAALGMSAATHGRRADGAVSEEDFGLSSPRQERAGAIGGSCGTVAAAGTPER